MEDELWQYAANLILEIESVSTNFVSQAFFESEDGKDSSSDFSYANTKSSSFSSLNITNYISLS